MLNPKSLAVC